METDKPYLIIVLGPTASGKGSLPDKVFKYLNMSNTEYTNILIDDLIVKSPHYKKLVAEYIKELKQGLRNNNKKNGNNNSIKKINEKIIAMFLDPTDEMINKFNEFYYESRQSVECYSGNKCDKNSEACESCDKKNDELLKEAFKNNENIVLETTGTYWPEWIFKFSDNVKNYNIIMSWSIVGLCELIMRNKKRASNSISRFLNNGTNNKNTPRLPEIRKDAYTSKVKQIIKVFKEYNKSGKLFTENNNTIRLILVDNNTSEEIILYDSFNSTTENNFKKGNNAINSYKVYNNCNRYQELSNLTKKALVSKPASLFKGGSKKTKKKQNSKQKKKRA